MKIVIGLFSYGGVEEATVDCVLREIHWGGQHGLNIGYHRISGDALIPRSRSRALGKFYSSSEPGDVLVMVDHDMEWRPGDLCHIAQEAAQKDALVGGLYCKRAFGKGWASRVDVAGEVEFGSPGLIPTNSLATGFMAIPYNAVTKVLDALKFDSEKFQAQYKATLEAGDPQSIRTLGDLSIDRIVDGAWKTAEHDYYDFFRCIRVPTGGPGGTFQFISEDWAFSMRCVHSGVESFISTYPIITHHGSYGYKIPDGMDAECIKASQDGKNKNPASTKNKNKRARRAQK